MSYERYVFVLAILSILLASCGRSSPKPEEGIGRSDDRIAESQWRALRSLTVFFGHQSVGQNILEGIRDLSQSSNGLQLEIRNGIAADTPALYEFAVGENGDASWKARDFVAKMERASPPRGSILMFKFCYVDVKRDTDVSKLFESYRAAVTELRSRYPGRVIVHTTMPLTTVESWPEYSLRRALGRYSRRDLNIKRNQYNGLLRREYRGEPIFDLAAQESTRRDGTRSYFMFNGSPIYTLAPEWTSDGGHLNEAGRRQLARALLTTLVSVAPTTGAKS